MQRVSVYGVPTPKCSNDTSTTNSYSFNSKKMMRMGGQIVRVRETWTTAANDRETAPRHLNYMLASTISAHKSF